MLSGSISILQSADVNLSGFLVEKMLTQEKSTREPSCRQAQLSL